MNSQKENMRPLPSVTQNFGPCHQHHRPLPLRASCVPRETSAGRRQLLRYMFITSKLEETCSLSVSAFLFCADRSYGKKGNLQAERSILKPFEHNMSYTNCYTGRQLRRSCWDRSQISLENTLHGWRLLSNRC
jgi:hypothetical protein